MPHLGTVKTSGSPWDVAAIWKQAGFPEPVQFAKIRHLGQIKVGRNDLCPCGSGKKFKKCHLAMPLVAAGQRPNPPQSSLPPHFWDKVDEHFLKERFTPHKRAWLR